MTVKIIDPNPDRSVVRECICRNCGVKLSFVPKDIQSKTYKDYDDESDTSYFIQCASCSEPIYVKRYG